MGLVLFYSIVSRFLLTKLNHHSYLYDYYQFFLFPFLIIIGNGFLNILQVLNIRNTLQYEYPKDLSPNIHWEYQSLLLNTHNNILLLYYENKMNPSFQSLVVVKE